jgi:hypothetical protein
MDNMVNMRKSYDATFRAKVALEAVKGEKALAELTPSPLSGQEMPLSQIKRV